MNPGLPGDYNDDGIVNIADYTVWRDKLGAPASTLDNDIDGGTIDTRQYLTWKNHFGNTQPAAAAVESTVPEPAAVLLLLLAAGLWLCSGSSVIIDSIE